MVTEENIQQEYPLHLLVWKNEYKLLANELNKKIHDIEKLDNRGRTPLMLAVTLGYLESTKILLNFEANVNCENKDGWTVVQEAVATKDPELLHIVLERRDLQRYTSRVAGIPDLLQKLKDAPDFYVEMKWEFTSWVPLLYRMCPSDVYKVYKQGSSVRVDTTLLGFDHTSWQRGNRSYIFQGKNDGATLMEIDHDLQQVFYEEMRASQESLEVLLPNEDTVSHRLTNPIVTTYIDTDKINFERNKAGIWGWRSDKNEVINGHDCKVFSATNVEFVTKTRSEHLSEQDKARCRSLKSPLQNFLGIAEVSETTPLQPNNDTENNEEFSHSTNPCNITMEEYFDSEVDLGSRDIGRPKEVNIKIQKFRANLWLCENYPLSLPEQILPIVDLMAISSSHFAKLRDFIQLQLPSGFPVKIEIPLFHVLNARITFGNIFAMDNGVPRVSAINEDERLTCVLDESLFSCPANYVQIGNANVDTRRQYSTEEEDELLQFALQQSLMDSGTDREEVDIWEALRGQKPSRPHTPINFEEQQLQRAIQASLEECQRYPASESSSMNTLTQQLSIAAAAPIAPNDNDDNATNIDYDLRMALIISQREKEQEEKIRLNDEQMLKKVLELSLKEK